MKKLLVIGLVVFIAIYLAEMLWINGEVRSLVHKMYNSDGTYSSEFKDNISKEMFEKLLENTHDESVYPSYVKYKPIERITIDRIFSWHIFLKANSTYYYSFKLSGTSNNLVKIKLRLKNWKWVITDVEEPEGY